MKRMKRREEAESLAVRINNPALNNPAMDGEQKKPFQKNKIPYALDYLAMDGE